MGNGTRLPSVQGQPLPPVMEENLGRAPNYGPSGSASVFASSSSAGAAVVKKELLIDVVGMGDYKVNNKSDAKWNPLPVKEILKNAEAQVGKRRNYDVIKANCEHFVNELRYRKSVSYQVLRVAIGVIAVGAAASVSVPAAGVIAAGLIGFAFRAARGRFAKS
ncbi:phospholipase A and acyltransferase 3-like [Chiloscyllium plagiosum]|uniref:phospholipase A and acyltransferase 3-like n=1 Tax=Chiloscyllium plagiosum TaxID=36176 RepID=UPI001CB7EEBD|nr:phospholipase A and acyltransferase 3-like [Chiloscyllium plagiosum]